MNVTEIKFNTLSKKLKKILKGFKKKKKLKLNPSKVIFSNTRKKVMKNFKIKIEAFIFFNYNNY